jgi:hypothetical protein
MLSASFSKTGETFPLFTITYQLRGFGNFRTISGQNVGSNFEEFRRENPHHKGLLNPCVLPVYGPFSQQQA